MLDGFLDGSIVDERPSRRKKRDLKGPERSTSHIKQSDNAPRKMSAGSSAPSNKPLNSFNRLSGMQPKSMVVSSSIPSATSSKQGYSSAKLPRGASNATNNRSRQKQSSLATDSIGGKKQNSSQLIKPGNASGDFFHQANSSEILRNFNLARARSPTPDKSVVKVPNGASNAVFKCRSRSYDTQDKWYPGEVIDQPLEAIVYVKPMVKLPKEFLASKDVYIRKDRIEGCSCLLPLKKGDKIDFSLSTKFRKDEQTPQGIKPSAHKAKLQSFCAPRSLGDLKLYFVAAMQRLDESSTRTETINSVMMSDALWFYIFNANCSDQDVYQTFQSDVLDFVFLLANYMEDFPSRRREIFSLIVERNFIDNLKCGKDKESKGLRFAKLAITLEPALLKKVLPILSSLVKSSDSDLASGLYDMLLKVGSVIDLSNWHDLTQIPTIEEFFGDPLEKVKYLKPVLLSSGYKDTDDYLNVYYRLLRTECFSAIQKGIKAMKMGDLDERDMSVYEKVFVRNIDMKYSSIRIFLQFSLKRPVLNWQKSRKLMFGNLLCITIKGDFSDPIWLTVADRDGHVLQKHSIIGVELISFTSSDTDTACIIRNLMLHSGKMTMVESPTYFQSFQYVLKSLKNSEINKFALVNEIVHGRFKKSANCRSLISPHLSSVGYKDFEDSQKMAFLHALESTVGIIQGPPGTGKTYVGAKLAQMFLCLQDQGSLDNLLGDDGFELTDFTEDFDFAPSMSPKNSPILILTYKNHALDEFLKDCTAFCDKEFITRIGSQSKEDVLNSCLLHNKMKNSNTKRMPTRYLIEEIEELFLQFSSLLSALERSKVFTLANFISFLSLEQLNSFIENAIGKPWKSPPKSLTVNIQSMQLYYTEWKVLDEFRDEITGLIASPSLDLSRGSKEEKIKKTVVLKVKNAYENHWVPNRGNLISLTELQQRGAVFFNSHQIDNTEENEVVDDFRNDELSVDFDDLDEDYINEQTCLRFSAYDEDHTGCHTSNDFRSQNMAKLENILANAKEGQKLKGKGMFCLSDFPTSSTVNQAILKCNNLWSLSETERYMYIYSFLHSCCNELLEKMNEILEKINILRKEKKSIDDNNKLEVLKSQKIVGATIIGASVQLSLISKLAPKVVLVEEAAEVLESCLVAVLSKSVKKLILIGDHKQLKPQVDTFDLRREHNFHISMMERLIEIGFPYERLLRQGRMRPEFSCMLKDIYPDYKDFPDLEKKNKKILCLPHSMFFWSHKFPENKDRSVKNVREANMVMALALFFVASGVNEADITILCAYLGQVQLVRKLYRDILPKSTSQKSSKQLIDIRTIDEYQGDENEFVIVSLTRSNSQRKLGFLKEIERRCVAQSRAKCGLYFVGNASMFRGHKNNIWRIIMETMDKQNLIREKLPITCYRHPDIIRNVVQKDDVTKKGILDNSQLMYYVQENNWCNVKCNQLFPCEIEAHRCKKPCTPRHDDSKCHTMVEFTFIRCHHKTQKPCYMDEEAMKCRIKIEVNLPKCGHKKQVGCHEWFFEKNGIVCTETCSQLYNCKDKHKCEKICGRDHHAHFAEDCPVQVEFEIPKCKHPAHVKKVCGKPIPPVKCKFNLKYKSQKCGHDQSRKCSEEEKCIHMCSKQRPDCGHPCSIICSKPCLGVDCQICAAEYQRSLDIARKIAKEKLEDCKTREADPGFFNLLPMSSDEMVTSSGVKEKCESFLSLYSSARLKDIVSVWTVQCPSNSSSFWEYALKANGVVREELYKLSSGFLDTDQMWNKVDLLTSLFQSANNCFQFTKYASKRVMSLPGNDYSLVIAEVLLGDSISSENMSKEKKRGETVITFLNRKKKDSVITKNSNAPAIYSVYDPSQIHMHLKYIVHFTTEKLNTNIELITQDALKDLPEGEKLMTLSEIDLRDVSNPLIEMVHQARALYKGDCSQRDSQAQSRQPLKEIKAVGIVVNHKANQAYEEKLKEWKGKYKEIYAYHATDPKNVASIVETNLDPNRKAVHGRAHGEGCYFSEHPEFSFRYGQETMFIFKLLLVDKHYKKVQPDRKGFCEQIVLQDASMFKPKFVLHF